MIPIFMKDTTLCGNLHPSMQIAPLLTSLTKCKKYYHYGRGITLFIYGYPPADGVHEKLRMLLFSQEISR